MPIPCEPVSSWTPRRAPGGAHDVQASGTATREACAILVPDGPPGDETEILHYGATLTLIGSANWTHERHAVESRVTTWRGSVDWLVSSTGESGRCPYDVTDTYRAEDAVHTLTGTSCGIQFEHSEGGFYRIDRSVAAGGQ